MAVYITSKGSFTPQDFSASNGAFSLTQLSASGTNCFRFAPSNAETTGKRPPSVDFGSPMTGIPHRGRRRHNASMRQRDAESILRSKSFRPANNSPSHRHSPKSGSTHAFLLCLMEHIIIQRRKIARGLSPPVHASFFWPFCGGSMAFTQPPLAVH